MRRLILPSVLLTLAVAFRGEVAGRLFPETWTLIVRGMFIFVVLLAWRFRRGRIAWAATVLALTAEALLWDGFDPEERRSLIPLLTLLVPLDLVMVALLREGRLASRASVVRFAALGAQALLVVIFVRHSASAAWLAALTLPLVELPPLAGFPLSQLAFLALTVAVTILTWRLMKRRTAFEAGLISALVATVLAFIYLDESRLFLVAGMLFLALSVIDDAFSLAFEDGLTGLPARRALEESLLHLGGSYAIAMVDIDHFKKLNDRHGHEVGDQVLRLISSRLGRVGGGGRPFRYGGEEFCILFSGKSAKEAEPHLEALRRAIAERPFAVRSPNRPKRKPKTRSAASTGRPLKVTVSLGVAERNAKRGRPEEVLKAADQALYRAKRAGRNRLVVGR